MWIWIKLFLILIKGGGVKKYIRNMFQKMYCNTVVSVVDPDPNWIRIQDLSGSVFQCCGSETIIMDPDPVLFFRDPNPGKSCGSGSNLY